MTISSWTLIIWLGSDEVGKTVKQGREQQWTWLRDPSLTCIFVCNVHLAWSTLERIVYWGKTRQTYVKYLNAILSFWYPKWNTRTHHANEVSGNAKHAQISTDDGVVGFREAISHCLNLPTQSNFEALPINMQPAMSEAEESTKLKMANVRGQILFRISSICRRATERLGSKNEKMKTSVGD